MNDRLMALIGALVSLYLVIALLMPPSTESLEQVSRPTTEDRGTHGLYALAHWLAESGVPTKSFRLRYDELALETGSSSGNVLVVSLPQTFPARESEKEHLVNWISLGNHVLVLAAVHDAPPWAGIGTLSPVNAFLSDLGVRFSPVTRDSVSTPERRRRALRELLADDDAGRTRTLEPAGPLPLLRNVKAVEARSVEMVSDRYRLRARSAEQFHLVVLRDAKNHEADFWSVRIGDGRLWLSSYSGLFDNESLSAPGNAQLISNLVGGLRAAGGKVLFDDMHQGLSAIYDPDAFFGDSRLHRTLMFMLVFWLLYVVGRSNRLGPVTPRAKAPRAIAYIRAAAGLYARRLTRPATARALLATFFNDLRAHHGLPLNGEPAWDLIRPAATPDEIAALERWQRTTGGRRPNLLSLTQLLTGLRRKLI